MSLLHISIILHSLFLSLFSLLLVHSSITSFLFSLIALFFTLQRAFVMQEVRYALYFCRTFWETYEKALALGDTKQQDWVKLQVRSSTKVKHLTSYLIRAKALYSPSSVVDVPMHVEVKKEIEYAEWIAARMAELSLSADKVIADRREAKMAVVNKLAANSSSDVTCKFCGRTTKKHLDFCQNCGKRNVNAL